MERRKLQSHERGGQEQTPGMEGQEDTQAWRGGRRLQGRRGRSRPQRWTWRLSHGEARTREGGRPGAQRLAQRRRGQRAGDQVLCAVVTLWSSQLPGEHAIAF